MHSLHQVKILPYQPHEVFSIVLDVESYSEFLPWCEGARIISKSKESFIAEIVIRYNGFHEKYQSLVIPTITNDNYIIEVEAVSGPFKFLKNKWQFSKFNNQCQVEFTIEFAFKSLLLDKIMGVFFTKATEKMIEAFEERAKTLKNSS